MTDQPTAQDYDQDTPARFTQAESPGEMLLSSRRNYGDSALIYHAVYDGSALIPRVRRH